MEAEKLFQEDPDSIETIVMEGDFVRGSLQEGQMDDDVEASAKFKDPGFSCGHVCDQPRQAARRQAIYRPTYAP